MNVELRASNGVVVVTDDSGPSTRTMHKYAVLEDRRRVDTGTHATVSDFSKIVVEHSQTVVVHDGTVVDVRWEPDPNVSHYLRELGATIELNPKNVETDEVAV